MHSAMEIQKLTNGEKDEKDKNVNLDTLLVHLGQFGKFQLRNYFLICLVVIYSALPFGYIFLTRNSDYRCFIDGCDDPENPVYDTPWMSAAIPDSGLNYTRPKQCSHHRTLFEKNNSFLNQCDANSFDRFEKVQCDRFVFENGDATIERDFNITCEENLFKLTIVGTLDNLGELVFLPLSGFISDRFGRRVMMITGVLASTVCGLLKSFTPSYASFLLFEILETCLSCGTYSAAYILAVELVPPKKRVLASTLISCAYAIGEALLGIAAWLTGSWRMMLRILYTPAVLFVFYFWLVNESVRWLLSKNRVNAAKRILLKVASTNGTKIPEETLSRIGIHKDDKKESFWNIFKSPTITMRLFVSAFVWICCVFVYYGFTLHAVAISGNMYFNFIAVTFIEIPAYIVSYLTMDVVGRKISLSSSLFVGGLASFAFIFVSEEMAIIRLILFLAGKFSVTIAFTTLYMYTTELFPTTVRHLLLATCSTFGRIGSMVAPQIPMLAKISPSLPLIMFGTMATLAGVLSLTFPETLNTKLPDTIAEAEKIQHNASFV